MVAAPNACLVIEILFDLGNRDENLVRLSDDGGD